MQLESRLRDPLSQQFEKGHVYAADTKTTNKWHDESLQEVADISSDLLETRLKDEPFARKGRK